MKGLAIMCCTSHALYKLRWEEYYAHGLKASGDQSYRVR